MMKNFKFKILGISLLATALLTACGGGDDNNASNPQNPSDSNTSNNSQLDPKKDSITFPLSIFILDDEPISKDRFFFFSENRITQRNNELNHQFSIIFKQNGVQTTESAFVDSPYVLTKDKLYVASNSNNQQFSYLIKNTDSSLVTSYESNGSGLSETMNYRKIDLSNQPVHSTSILNAFFPSYDEANSSTRNFKKAFSALSQVFPKGATCYQYLTLKANQSYLSFDNHPEYPHTTLNEWVAHQKKNNHQVVEEIWAGYRVAYLRDVDSTGINYSSASVVEMNGKLYSATYESDQLNNFADEYLDNPQIYKDGICDIYNESAANVLRTAIATLPQN